MVIHRRIGHRLGRRLQGERRAAPRGVGRRRTDTEPNLGWRPAILIALAIALSDWAVKWWITQTVPLDGFIVVWSDRVALWHVQNNAMILGLYGSLPIEGRIGIAILSAVTASVLLFEVVSRGHRLLPRHRKWVWLFVGLASGGMLGNLGERAIHWWVTDYLSFAWGDLWLPPGNIADLAIFLSLPAALPVILFELKARARREAAESGRAVTDDSRASSAVEA